MQRVSSRVTAVLAVLVGFQISARSVFASVEEPPSSGWGFSPDDIARAIFNQAGKFLADVFNNMIGVHLARLALTVWGFLTYHLWDLFDALFNATNILTQLPPQWFYELEPVRMIVARLSSFALAAIGTATALTLVLVIVNLMAGRPIVKLLLYFGRQIIAGASVVYIMQIAKFVGDFANDLAHGIGDPKTGFAQIQRPGADDYGVVAVMGVFFIVAFLWFFWGRARTLVMACVLLALAPIALACWTFPIGMCQRIAAGWAQSFVGVVFVQVAQAVCLTVGAFILGRSLMSAPGPAEIVVGIAISMGAFMAAGGFPRQISRWLENKGPISQEQAMQVARMTLIAAGVGVAAPAAGAAAQTASSVAGKAAIQQVGASINVRSLLGDSQQHYAAEPVD